MKDPPPTSTTKDQLPVGQNVLIVRGTHRHCTGTVFRQTANGVEIRLHHPHKGQCFTILPYRQLLPSNEPNEVPPSESSPSHCDGQPSASSNRSMPSRERTRVPEPTPSRMSSKHPSPAPESSSGGDKSTLKISLANLGMIKTLVVLGERRAQVWEEVLDQILADVK